jgi:cobalt/nickel transport system permease protein
VNPGLLEPYQPGTSAVHRLPAAAKCAAAVGAVFAVVLLPRASWPAYAVTAAALLAVAALSRIPPGRLVARLLLVEPFALGVAALSLLQPGGARIFADTVARSTLCLSAMVLLAATTRFSDLLRVLWSARVPRLLVTTLALMHRYLFLLVDEAGRMVRARRSRSFAGGRRAEWRSSATVVAQLFVRSSERAERIWSAMCARGWKT